MNFRTIAEIENDIQNKQTELDQTTHEIQKSILVNAIAALEAEKKQVAEALSQQNLQERVDQAKETGYILDTIEIDGLPAIAFSHTPENHELLAIAVQKLFLAQEDAFNKTINNMDYELTQEKLISNDLTDIVEKLERNNSQLTLELKHAELSRDNAAKIICEKDEEIKRLQEIKTNTEAVPVAPLSAEEQDTKLIADLMGNRLKVTNIRFKDESGLDRRKVLANNALTGEEIEEYAIYSKTRWEEIGLESAAQLQVDYANKKAELELQNAIIPIQAESMEYVTEQDEAATDKLPIEEEVRAAAFRGTEETEGNAAMDEVVGKDQEGAVNNSPVTIDQLNQVIGYINHLSRRVEALDGASIGVQLAVA